MTYEPLHEKTNNLQMRNQRYRSASQLSHQQLRSYLVEIYFKISGIFHFLHGFNDFVNMTYEPLHEKTNNLQMRNQRYRSASQLSHQQLRSYLVEIYFKISGIFHFLHGFNDFVNMTYELLHEKTINLHMRNKRHRSISAFVFAIQFNSSTF